MNKTTCPYCGTTDAPPEEIRELGACEACALERAEAFEAQDDARRVLTEAQAEQLERFEQERRRRARL